MSVHAYASFEPASSNDFRNAILSQHEGLRELVADTVHLAALRVRPGGQLDALRERARRLFLTLQEHLAFEERAFPQALSDVIGWGSVLREQIEESHERQRHVLAAALAALEPETLSWVELARNVRAFATSLLRDIEKEDAALLNADLDALATDSEGG